MDQARTHGATSAVDGYGNVVVTIPGSLDAPGVAIQSHLDMVRAAREGVQHNWASDSIKPRIDGSVVRATGTSLGADNGIGVAMGLALVTAGAKRTLPIELIFTVEEEIGLRGASHLDPSLIHSKYLINLDSEEVEKLTIGCTGGATLRLTLPLTVAGVDAGFAGLLLEAKGGLGGHSGLEIHKPRVNALKEIAAAIELVRASDVPARIVSFAGGTAANSIPGSADATVVVPIGDVDRANRILSETGLRSIVHWSADDPDFELLASSMPVQARAFDEESTVRLLSVISGLPHGVQRMSDVHAGKPETSVNLAMIGPDSKGVYFTTSVRSFTPEGLDTAQAAIRAIAANHGGAADLISTYPGWPPRDDSPLIRHAAEAFRQVYGVEPEIEVVHAGLECGAIVDRLPNLDAISFGPEIRGAHTPDESVTIASVRTTWRLLTTLLDRLDAEAAG